jgi:hypothetical protein
MGAYQVYLELQREKQASALAMAATGLVQNLPDILEHGQHLVKNPWMRQMAKDIKTSVKQVGVGGTAQGAVLRTINDATPSALRTPLSKGFRAAGNVAKKQLGADSDVTNFFRTAEQAAAPAAPKPSPIGKVLR